MDIPMNDTLRLSHKYFLISTMSIFISPVTYAELITGHYEYNQTITPENILGPYNTVNIDSTSSGSPIGLYANGVDVPEGRINVNIDTSIANARGYNINNAVWSDILTATDININSSAKSGSAIGVNVVNNSSLSGGDEFFIRVESLGQSIGFNVGGSNNNIDMSSLAIQALSPGNATAFYVAAKNTVNILGALDLVSSGTVANGIAVAGGDTNINVNSANITIQGNVNGDGSSSGGNGISLMGSAGIKNVSMEQASIVTYGDNTRGVAIDNAAKNSNLRFGNLYIDNFGYNDNIGIFLKKGNEAVFNVDSLVINSTGSNSDAIIAHNGVLNVNESIKISSDRGSGIIASAEESDGVKSSPKINIVDNNGSTIKTFGDNFRSSGEGSSIDFRSDITSWTFLTSEGGSVFHAQDKGVINSDISFSEMKSGGYALLAESGGELSLTGKHLLINDSYEDSLIKSTGVGSRVSIDGLDSKLHGDVYSGDSGDIRLSLAGTVGSYLNGDIITSRKGTVESIFMERSILSGNIVASDGGVAKSTFKGWSEFDGGAVSSDGGDISISLYDNSVWNNYGDSTINSLAVYNSDINFNVTYYGNDSNKYFNSIQVKGDYFSDLGSLYFNTALGDDGSQTNKLIVNGNTAGKTLVWVRNHGGNGAATVNGIELIHVDGESAGEFLQVGRIVAGSWDYTLMRGDGENYKNWYLVNNGLAPSPDPIPDPDSEPTPNMRPEGGSYLANLTAANTLFNTRLHDRSGETWYQDPVTGETQVTSLWLRQVGSHSKFRDGSGQLKTQANSYVAQLGGDLAQWSSNGVNEGHLGLMAGYASSHSNTTSSRTGYGSKGSLNGYSVGLYGTWFENKKDDAGLYLDSWLQYSWFNNSVNGEGLASESYKSKGLTVSMETGYTLKLGETTGSQGSVNAWFIQPQAQVTWMGVKADSHRESNGTVVIGEGDNNVQTRLGVRTFLKGQHAMDAGTGRIFEPFVEANWLHNSRSFSTTMDGARVSQAGSRNLGEIKAGVEAKLNPNLNLWGSVGTQVGTRGYQDSTAIVGVKVNF